MLNVRYLLTEALRSLRLGDIADADVRIDGDDEQSTRVQEKELCHG